MNKEQDKPNSTDTPEESQAPESPDFHGATVVDSAGNETKITEDMVRQAIHSLDEDAYPELDD